MKLACLLSFSKQRSAVVVPFSFSILRPRRIKDAAWGSVNLVGVLRLMRRAETTDRMDEVEDGAKNAVS